MSYLYHLTAWPYLGEDALSPESLAKEGFVHLSDASQVLRTAQRWYSGESTLAILVLDSSSWGELLRWEDLYGRGEAFPHLYGPIPTGSLVATLRLEKRQNGEFQWPQGWLPELGPLWEGPDEGAALIEPSRRFPQPILPELAVLTLFPNGLESLRSRSGVETLERPGSAIGPDPILVMSHQGHRMSVCSPGVGAPLAAVAVEELIALGARKFVLCGGAGALQPDLELGRLVLVEQALRDEGLSHHYLPANSKVAVSPSALGAVDQALRKMGADFVRGLTWTTDALYRETPSRIARRREQGALTVEMECAAVLAVAQYRKVPLVPLLFCGDTLATEAWDFRDWTSSTDLHERMFWLACEAALALESVADGG